MRIAVPVTDGQLASHFGHCEKFAFFDVDPVSREVTGSHEVIAPPHQPGMLPQWLKGQGVTVVIAGGMGSRAQNLFQMASIEVITGAPDGSPQALVQSYLDGSLTPGPNSCGH